jgi:hypothetical protein
MVLPLSLSLSRCLPLMAVGHGGMSGGAGAGWLEAAPDEAEMLVTSGVRRVLVDCGDGLGASMEA